MLDRHAFCLAVKSLAKKALPYPFCKYIALNQPCMSHFVLNYTIDVNKNFTTIVLWKRVTCLLYQYYASEKRIPVKWRRQEYGYDSTSMNNRNAVAMDRLACPRSASSRYRRFFSWRIKRSMWTLHRVFADRSTSQVYLWTITYILQTYTVISVKIRRERRLLIAFSLISTFIIINCFPFSSSFSSKSNAS